MNAESLGRLVKSPRALRVTEGLCCGLLCLFGLIALALGTSPSLRLPASSEPVLLAVYRIALNFAFLALSVTSLYSAGHLLRSRILNGTDRASRIPRLYTLFFWSALPLAIAIPILSGAIATVCITGYFALISRVLYNEVTAAARCFEQQRGDLHRFETQARKGRESLQSCEQLRMNVTAHLQQSLELQRQLENVRESEHLMKATLGSITEGIIVVGNDGTLLYTNHAANELLGFPDWHAPSASWVEAYTITSKGDEEIRQRYSWPLVRAVRGEFVDKERVIVINPLTLQELTLSVNASPLTDEAGEQVGAVAVLRDNSRLSRAEAEKKQAHRLYQYHKWALDQFAIVVEMDADGKITYVNDRFCQLSRYSRLELIGETHAVTASDTHDAAFHEEIWESVRAGNVWQGEMKCLDKYGQEYWVDSTIVPCKGQDGQTEKYLSIRTLINERKRAEEERERLGKELAESSRQAGMAEVATGVLHNVGNVLNSVNVSANILVDKIKGSRLETLLKASAIIENESDLANFFANDPRANAFPTFLAATAKALARDRERMLEELNALTANIAHVKEIVGMQQSFAKAGGLIQVVSLNEMVDDSIKIVDSTVSSLLADVKRVYEFDAMMQVDKHKLLQILINLITNAKQAVEHLPVTQRHVEVRIEANAEDRVEVIVEDNGVGIEADLQSRLFQHGFTTKKNGHGFGLHSSAIAAKQMGGALRVHSEGEGHGARFVLELPLDPESKSPNNSLTLLRR